MSTRERTPTEDKLETLHNQLIEAAAELASSDGWKRMLTIAVRFHDYSGGGGGMIELRECRRAPAVSQRLKLLWRHGQVE